MGDQGRKSRNVTVYCNLFWRDGNGTRVGG